MSAAAWRSSLELFERETGRIRVVLRTPGLIEAPNWDPLGPSLLVNGGGQLWRVALKGRAELAPVDTGFADACNNDHGFAPDGGRIAISHETAAGSTIYVLPAAGGTPVQVTARNPSYWHGWSPDGAKLAYSGARNGRHDIYAIPADGGAETRLTSDAGHNDGPDYAPDGAAIWFNSDRSGHAQIWRMAPDGGRPERMTEDGFVNWFPHPSPDGTTVLLAYPPGTTGHPPDRNVALRLMDPGGGDVRTVVELFGGQGAINVPCWAPDGSAFAFVRYARPS